MTLLDKIAPLVLKGDKKSIQKAKELLENEYTEGLYDIDIKPEPVKEEIVEDKYDNFIPELKAEKDIEFINSNGDRDIRDLHSEIKSIKDLDTLKLLKTCIKNQIHDIKYPRIKHII